MHLKSSQKCGKLVEAGLETHLKTMSEAVTISEVARRSGVAPSALRFYEDQRLIHSERASSGHRRYARSVLRLVAFIGHGMDVLRERSAPASRLDQKRDANSRSSAPVTCVMPLLARYGVTATCRASFGLYNTKAEVDTLAQALIKAQDLFA